METCRSFITDNYPRNVFRNYRFVFTCKNNFAKRISADRKEGECVAGVVCPESCKNCEVKDDGRLTCPDCDKNRFKYWDFNKNECLMNPNGGRRCRL